jgi:hypothetical protein
MVWNFLIRLATINVSLHGVSMKVVLVPNSVYMPVKRLFYYILFFGENVEGIHKIRLRYNLVY